MKKVVSGQLAGSCTADGQIRSAASPWQSEVHPRGDGIQASFTQHSWVGGWVGESALHSPSAGGGGREGPRQHVPGQEPELPPSPGPLAPQTARRAAAETQGAWRPARQESCPAGLAPPSVGGTAVEGGRGKPPPPSRRKVPASFWGFGRGEGKVAMGGPGQRPPAGWAGGGCPHLGEPRACRLTCPEQRPLPATRTAQPLPPHLCRTEAQPSLLACGPLPWRQLGRPTCGFPPPRAVWARSAEAKEEPRRKQPSSPQRCLSHDPEVGGTGLVSRVPEMQAKCL